jgi:hypothetical protein
VVLAYYEHLPIYKATFDFFVCFEKIVAKFSRYHISAIYGRFLRPQNCCDIVFQFGQIHFRGFALLMLQEQTEKMTGEFLERSTWLPEEGKKAIRQWIDAYQQGCGNFKKHVDEAYKRVEAFLES